jgi:hypothetical protein
MRRSILGIALATAVGTVGCNGTADMPDNSVAPVCRLLFTGGPVANPNATCTVTSAYRTASNSSTVNATAGSSSLIGGDASLQLVPAPFTFTFTSIQPGRIAAGTYSDTTSGLVGTLTITDAGSNTYRATVGAGTNVGTFTLTITKSTIQANTSSGTSYLIDGTLDATVPALPSSGASGTISVHTTFTSN